MLETHSLHRYLSSNLALYPGLPDPSDQKKPNQVEKKAKKKPNIFNNVISIILITKDIVGVYVWITSCKCMSNKHTMYILEQCFLPFWRSYPLKFCEMILYPFTSAFQTVRREYTLPFLEISG